MVKKFWETLRRINSRLVEKRTRDLRKLQQIQRVVNRKRQRSYYKPKDIPLMFSVGTYEAAEEAKRETVRRLPRIAAASVVLALTIAVGQHVVG